MGATRPHIDGMKAAASSGEADGAVANDWCLMRKDDNGNRLEMRRFSTRVEAERVAAEFEARAHKQMYWVEQRAR